MKPIVVCRYSGEWTLTDEDIPMVWVVYNVMTLLKCRRVPGFHVGVKRITISVLVSYNFPIFNTQESNRIGPSAYHNVFIQIWSNTTFHGVYRRWRVGRYIYRRQGVGGMNRRRVAPSSPLFPACEIRESYQGAKVFRG